MDNWINFGTISRAADGAIEIAQLILEPETKLGMVWVERDLGRVVKAVLDRYRTNPQMLGRPVYCVGGLYSTGDLVAEIRRQTGGGPARMVQLPTSGLRDLDVMYGYYNEWGVYTDVEIPQPEMKEWGVRFRSLTEFVREAVLPHLSTLEGTRDQSVPGI